MTQLSFAWSCHLRRSGVEHFHRRQAHERLRHIHSAEQARSLSPQERAQLTQELLESVEREADPQVQQSWETEIESRIAKYERGEATLIPAEEVFAAARRLTQ